MPKMEDGLIRLFREAGLDVRAGERPHLTARELTQSGCIQEVQRVYSALGGCLDAPPLRVGQFDMIVEDTPVELDESRHFNRYRALTLDSAIYSEVAGFDPSYYRHLCQVREKDCLKDAKFGGYWSNGSCEEQFGPAAQPGMLQGGGAPRWKQRAFYDFLKDLTSVVESRAVVRFAMWEDMPDASGDALGDLLLSYKPGNWRQEVVRRFHQRGRSTGLEGSD